MLLVLILCCYLTSLKALENEPSNLRQSLEDEWNSRCPNTATLLKAIYILTNFLPQDTTMLEPEKLKYALSTVMRFLEIESSKDKFKLDNNLSNFENQLDKLISNMNDHVQRDENEGDSKGKVRPENSMMYKCKYILGTLVTFINNAYTQVANYCKLTGKCNAINSSPLNLNFFDELNILSHNTMLQNLIPLNGLKHDLTKGVSEYKTPLTEIWKESTKPQSNLNHETKQDYDIMNILQTYKPNSVINQANGVSNAYPVENLDSRKQQKYNGLLNSFVNNDKLDYPLNGNASPQQSPSNIPDFNNLLVKDIFSSLNSLYNTNANQKDTKILTDANNNIQSYGHSNLNNNDFQSIYPYLNSLSFDSNKPKAANGLTKLLQSSSPEQPLYNNNIYSTNGFENKIYEFSHKTPTNIDSSSQIINPYPTAMNKNHLQDNIISFFQQSSSQNPQYSANYNKKSELLNKIQQQYVSVNDVNLSPYPYQSYKESLNRNTDILGLKREPQYTLTVPNTLTSQYNNYDSSINTIAADKIKHENYGVQLPDLSQSLSVSNLVKLNSVTRKYGDVELTFMLKRSQPFYEPFYYVKYRIPYNEFVYNMQNLLIQKPYLRSNPNQLYQSLLSVSNAVKISENIKDLNDEEMVKLTSTNGTFVTATLLHDGNGVENEQLKTIQDLNANLSVANILNLGMDNNQILEPIQNLLKTTMTATVLDNSFQSYPDVDHSRILNTYINSDYNTPVYQPNPSYYNSYIKEVNPAYSALYGISSTGYNTLPDNIVKKLLAANPPSNLNTYPKLAG
ncbi:putative uncharacterized protein DDB_G0282133 [Vanessa cardui]|uniref:putative uncharacterized protein DDB_G0282133 n=1 Tax=Vanessa cardui TaxID=171605 RepID=UPI001F12982B|nr:putative uncharacterized protein DDB_G0282133 [Vanessa cardui]